MSSPEIWSQLSSAGMARPWWYTSGLGSVALGVGGLAFVLMLFGLRRKSNPMGVFGYLLLASTPGVLTLPAFLVGQDPLATLGWAGANLPATGQSLTLSQAVEAGVILDQAAWCGMAGLALAFGVMVLSTIVGEIPILTSTVRAATRVVERGLTVVIRQDRRDYLGVLIVTQGALGGKEFPIQAGLISRGAAGSKGPENRTVAITLPDAVVSQPHARLSVSSSGLFIAHEGGRNGTFVRRSGRDQEVYDQPVAVEPGDTIFLGPPDHSASVALTFRRNGEMQ